MRGTVVRAGDILAGFRRATGAKARAATRFPRGYANQSYLVETDGSRYLLKIPPAGAPRVLRTVRFTGIAAAAALPTPRVVGYDVSGDPLPPFWVQEYVEDADDAERMWATLSDPERAAVGRAYGALVARMHDVRVDPDAPLHEEMRRRIGGRLAAVRALGEADEAALDRLATETEAALPLLARVETRLCHTDLYLENLLLRRGPGGWEIVALLDFEHGRASDPAEDFVKLEWWNFVPHPELRAPFLGGYGDPRRWGRSFDRRRELFCLYGIVAGIPYFRSRAEGPIDPARPALLAGDRAMLAEMRGRFRRWLDTGAACPDR